VSNAAKQLLVLARRDHAEAMRVAAGLTIFGHTVELVFVDRPVEDTEDNAAQAELLELTGIQPLSLLDDPQVPRIDAAGFRALCVQAGHVINL